MYAAAKSELDLYDYKADGWSYTISVFKMYGRLTRIHRLATYLPVPFTMGRRLDDYMLLAERILTPNCEGAGINLDDGRRR